MVGLGGFEPPTSPLSGVRSNQLSYRPNFILLNLIAKLAPPIKPNDQAIEVSTYMNGSSISLRRWSSRRFPYGYLVTTSPQSWITKWWASSEVRLPTSFATHSHGVTGGVYKARERIHRDVLIRDY